MPKTILIPTDFSIETLNMVKYAALNYPNDELEIVLMYSSFIPDSITELLFYSPDKVIDIKMSNEFIQACDILQNKFNHNISKIKPDIFHGMNNAAFENYIAAKKIDEAIIPQNYILKTDDNSFDPLPYIKNSDLKLLEIDWFENKNLPEKDKLAELFSH